MRQDRLRRRHAYERGPNGRDLYDISLSMSRPSLRHRLTGILMAVIPVVCAIGAIAWFMRAYIAPPTATIEPANFTERSALIDEAIFTTSVPRRTAETVRAPAEPGREQNTASILPLSRQEASQQEASQQEASFATTRRADTAATRPVYDVSAIPSALSTGPAPSGETRPVPPGPPIEAPDLPARAPGAPLALPSAVPSPRPSEAAAALPSDTAAALPSRVSSAASITVPLPRRRPRAGEVEVTVVGGVPIAIPPLPQERPASAPAPEARAAPPEPGFDRDRFF